MDGPTPRKIGAATRSRRDVSSSIVNTKMWAHGPLAKKTCKNKTNTHTHSPGKGGEDWGKKEVEG